MISDKDLLLSPLSVQLEPIFDKYGLAEIIEGLSGLQLRKAYRLWHEGHWDRASEALSCKFCLYGLIRALPVSKTKMKWARRQLIALTGHKL